MKPAPTTIFLDRDGVINEKRENDYVKSWEEFRFLPGALEGIRTLTEAGARLIVVTNQRGIALRKMSEPDLDEIHARMLSSIEQAGGRIAAIYHCPHDAGTCACRKPGTGLFEKAKSAFPGIDFKQSVVVGDSLVDLEAAARLGCPFVLVTTHPSWPSIVNTAKSRGFPTPQTVPSLRDFSRRLNQAKKDG